MFNLTRMATIGLSFVALSACASVGMAKEPLLDPADSKNTLHIMRKLQCSTVDNEPAVYAWDGVAYARRQGEKDLHMFDVEGMNIRQCTTIESEDGKKGFHLVSREILLYLDKDTGEVLKTWDNPWTGETVTVQHVANDPVNFKMYETNRDGEPAVWSGVVSGGTWWNRNTFPLWYPSPLGGEYQKEVGATYHATEMFNFFGRTDDLLDPKTTTAKINVGWSRISDWLPWMNMNGREGVLYMHTAGRKLSQFDELTDTMKNEIKNHYPEYAEPPPAGDPRKNMTSWEYYKEVSEGTIELPKR